ncbi:alcohol acetyltransferase [Mycena crocata]|nr:alcohol acetyltransferase [Mycena crocata]
MAAPTRLRPVGLMERFHITRHFLGMDSCIVGSAQYSAQDGSNLTEAILFPALRTLIEEHPALSVRLEGDETTANLYFVRLPTVDLSRVVQFTPEKNNLQAALEGQLARGFETQTDLPLWRVEVLADNTVLFAVHHGVGDGISLTAFHLALFRALQAGVAEKDTSPSVQVPTTIVFMPAIDQATNVRPSLGVIWSELFNLLAPVSWTKGRAAWTGPPAQATVNLTTVVRVVPFPAPEVAAFCAACRAHKATLTSALYGLAVCVLSRMLADDPARYERIASLVALSMRPVAGVSDEAICNYPSVVRTSFKVNPVLSWEDAAVFARELQVQKTKGREPIGMLRFLMGRYVPYMKAQLGVKRGSGFALSNLGRWSAPSVEGKWSVGGTVFAQCDVVTGSSFSINVAGDPTGAMNIAFCWGEKSIEAGFVEQFIRLFQEEFRGIIA